MTHWRNVVEQVLTVAGIGTILAAIVLSTDLVWQVGIALAGILMLEAGVWGIAQQLVPEERIYEDLRSTTGEFLQRVRTLNDAARRDDGAAVAEEREAMHEFVERRPGEAAGRRLFGARRARGLPGEVRRVLGGGEADEAGRSSPADRVRDGLSPVPRWMAP